jgi:hypothetical protein
LTFEVVGIEDSSIRVSGLVSGISYEFSSAAPFQQVDARDASFALEYPLLSSRLTGEPGTFDKTEWSGKNSALRFETSTRKLSRNGLLRKLARLAPTSRLSANFRVSFTRQVAYKLHPRGVAAEEIRVLSHQPVTPTKVRNTKEEDGYKETYKLIGIVLLICLAIFLGLILSLHVD